MENTGSPNYTKASHEGWQSPKSTSESETANDEALKMSVLKNLSSLNAVSAPNVSHLKSITLQ